MCQRILRLWPASALRDITGCMHCAYAYLRSIAGCIWFMLAELSLISARYRRLHMLHVCRSTFNRCLISRSARYRRVQAYAYLRGIAGCICFTFAELSLIVVRLPLCAVSQGSSLCLSARYRRLHMLHVCRIIFNRCSTPTLRGIAGFKLMRICAVSQAAYASGLPNYL